MPPHHTPPSVTLSRTRVAKPKRRRLLFIFPHASAPLYLPFPLKSSKIDGLNLHLWPPVSLPPIISPHHPGPIKGTDASAFCPCYTVVPSFLTLLAPILAPTSKKLPPPLSTAAGPPSPPRQPLKSSVSSVRPSSSSRTSLSEH
jgi:hypothetical protein